MSDRPQSLVSAGYDRIADTFTQWQAQIVGDPRERYIRRLLELTPEHPDVLEIGCGAGIEPTPTLARAGRLTGIDISAAQIERARRAVPGAELIHADVTTVKFEPESFDAVVALYVLTHVPVADLPRLLASIATWLREGGLLLATFGGGASHESVVDNWLGAPMFFSGLDVDTNERLVQQAGMTLLESRREPMQEPESEPGAGPEEAAFHWILARKSTG